MPSQDFSGQDLTGRSFKNQNLEGANFSGANIPSADFSSANLRGANFSHAKVGLLANFSGADIRSADFSSANLRGANFSHAKAGLQKRWAIFLVIVSWLLSGISGLISSYAGILAMTILFNSSHQHLEEIINQIVSLGAIILIITFFFAIITQGIQVAFTVVVAVAFAEAVVIAFTGTVAIGQNSALAVAVAFAFAGAGVGAVTVAGAVAVAGAFAAAFTFAFAFAAAFNVAVAGAGAGAAPLPLTVAVTLLNIYIGWRAIKGDEKYALIRNIAVAFAAFGSTSFRKANLTDINFTEATLKSTDFRKAILTRTCFRRTKKLEFIRPGTTYLQKAQVLMVLVTGSGINLNFDRQDLRGVHFTGADLVDASFIGTDLSKANLQSADLSRAKLIQAQLDGTDFTGATLTGACIKDWGITSDTKFDGVRCEYVYMRQPTKEDPDPLRKPDNRKEVFGDGEFGDFIKPIVDTLDLYHNQGVDPRAIAISFKQLAENHPNAELEIVAMEKRGEDKFLLRAKTADDADKSQLNAEYFDTYNQLKGLSEQEIRLRLQQLGSKIYNLENSVQSVLQGSSYYKPKTILILTANPESTTCLRLDKEVREIDVGLKRAKKREEFNLEQCRAVRVQDVSQALLDFEPQIVHFSGHGSQDDGLAFENETGDVHLVNTEALAELFNLFTAHIECVLLNACYSSVQADAIVKHIPYVIGMNKEISDKASIEFAIGFYAALGAGKPIEFSYQFGCNAIRLAGIPEHLTPVLKKKQ